MRENGLLGITHPVRVCPRRLSGGAFILVARSQPLARTAPGIQMVHPKTLLRLNGCWSVSMCQAAFAHLDASALVAMAADPAMAFLR